MKTVKFGIIGCGLMGKEFAGVAGRWCHLNEECSAPEIIAVCDANPAAMEWFVNRVPTVKYTYSDYKDLLANDEIEAVYCAVPHVLHKQIYVDIIESGKHFMGEKPFGMDQDANAAILEACRTVGSARVQVLLILPLSVPPICLGLTISPQTIIQSTLPL